MNTYDDCLRCGASVGDATACPQCGLPTSTPEPVLGGPQGASEGPVTAPVQQPPLAPGVPYPGQPYSGQPYSGQVPPPYGQQAYGYAAHAGPQLAGTGARIGAYVIDTILLAVVGGVFGLAIGLFIGLADASAGGDPASAESAARTVGNAVGVVVWFAYFVICAVTSGRTVGKLLCGIRLVSAADGSRVGFGAALGRYALLFVMVLPCGIPALICAATLGNHPQRRGWHDRAAGTLVVRA